MNELSTGFTGIEVDGVRFSNIGEMLCYMNKQRKRLIRAKKLLKDFVTLDKDYDWNLQLAYDAEQFLKEVEE